MKLFLSAEHDEFVVDIPVEYATLIEAQLIRLNKSSERRAFIDATLKHLARVLSRHQDPDLKPPTTKQIAFAHTLSRKHKVSIPPDALIYRDVMGDFLDKYTSKAADKYD